MTPLDWQGAALAACLAIAALIVIAAIVAVAWGTEWVARKAKAWRRRKAPSMQGRITLTTRQLHTAEPDLFAFLTVRAVPSPRLPLDDQVSEVAE